MRKIINRLRPWCALFFAVAIGIGGNAFAGHSPRHSPDWGYRNFNSVPLVSAVRRDDVNEARRMIQAGSDVNQWHAGLSLLHYAAIHGHREMINLLVSSGANLEAADNKGRTPLFFAAEFGDPNAVNALLHAGAQYKTGPGGQTMMQVAALNRYNPVPILKMLFPLTDGRIEYDNHGNNILHYAATNRERTGWWALQAIKWTTEKYGLHNLYRKKNGHGKTPYDLARPLHEESKKDDPTWACIHLIKPFNWRGCAPQRQPKIMDILDPSVNRKDHRWTWE